MQKRSVVACLVERRAQQVEGAAAQMAAAGMKRQNKVATEAQEVETAAKRTRVRKARELGRRGRGRQ